MRKGDYMGLFTPTYYAKSIYDIPANFYKNEGITVIFCDLDNTLDPFFLNEPSDQAIDLVKELRENGIEFIITSNNHGNRVMHYAEKLNVECHYSSKKPLGYKLKRFIKRKNFDKNSIVMIGDQILTDVIASKRTKVRVILTEPLVKQDLPITKINRFFDKKIRKLMKKKLEKREISYE